MLPFGAQRQRRSLHQEVAIELADHGDLASDVMASSQAIRVPSPQLAAARRLASATPAPAADVCRIVGKYCRRHAADRGTSVDTAPRPDGLRQNDGMFRTSLARLVGLLRRLRAVPLAVISSAVGAQASLPTALDD